MMALHLSHNSIDSRIDGAIASYLAGTAKNKIFLKSYLENFDVNRRTFVQSISNPTTSTQNDLYISTAGYWIYCVGGPYNRSGNWNIYYGYAFAGLNNYRNAGHEKALVELNNGKSGKYIFVDEKTFGTNKYPYIYDEYRKYLTYKIVSSGAESPDSGEAPTTQPTWGGPTSISWTNTYNWSGENSRQVSTNAGLRVIARESLILGIENNDYDTTKSGVQPVPWVNCMSGSTIFTTNMGSLYKKNQYNWSHRITNFWLGYPAKQALTRNLVSSSAANSYNSKTDDQRIMLSFNVPAISQIKGNDVIVLDVSNKVGEPAYYFSGLPIYQLPKTIEHLNIKFQVIINKSSSTDTSGIVFAIKKKQFNNVAIASESNDDLIFKKEYSATEIPEEIEVDLDEDKLDDVKNKTIWVKVNATNANCSVTLVPKDMYYY